MELQRKRPVTMDPYRIGALKEKALMSAISSLQIERDSFEGVEMYREAAEADRDARVLKKILYNEF